MATNAAGDRLGLTIYEAGQVGGAGFGGCPAGASNAVVAPGTLNARDLGAGAPDVVFSGAAQPDATAVSLSIGDGTSAVDVPASAVTLTAGSWRASVPAARLAALKDGTLTVAGAYTIPGGTVTGAALSVAKDTVAPGAPSVSPPPGTYDGAQSLAIKSDDPAAAVHYTTDGTDATAADRAVSGQLSVTASRTVKVVAVDPAGNAGPVAAFDYVIAPRPPQRIEVPGAPVVIVKSAPAPALLALGRLTTHATVTGAALRRGGLRASLRLPDGADALRLRLFRLSGGRRILVTSLFRFPAADGGYRLVVRSSAVRRLARGRYVLEATPGRSRRDLGIPSAAPFRVIR